jgi:hypothetical protein
MAMTLAQAVDNERMNQAIKAQNNPLVALFQGVGSGIQQGTQQRSELQKLFQLEDYKNKLRQQQDAIDFQQQKELQEMVIKNQRKNREIQRQQDIDMELAKVGITPQGDRSMAGEIIRVADDDMGAKHKRGVSKVEGGMMSLPGGEVGDVDGKVIPRREPTPITTQDKLAMLAEAKSGVEVSADDKIKAGALAVQIFGRRRAKDWIDTIVELRKEGKTFDDIGDMLRFSQQSEEFSGPVRGASEMLSLAVPSGQSELLKDMIDDVVSSGDQEAVKNTLKDVAIRTAPSTDKTRIIGQERTLSFLDEIEADLQALEDAGIDTNIFSGGVEDVNRKIGTVNEPRLRELATKIQIAIMNYRKAMSGAAFNALESQEYKDVFPSIGRTKNFNMANIRALRSTFGGDLDNFYRLSMGRNNYDQLFKGQGVRSPQADNNVQYKSPHAYLWMGE